MMEGQEGANNAARSAADSGRAAATIRVPATGRKTHPPGELTPPGQPPHSPTGHRPHTPGRLLDRTTTAVIDFFFQ